MHEVLGIHPDRTLDRDVHRGRCSTGADRGEEPRGTEMLEQTLAKRPALNGPEGAGVVIREDRFGAVTIDRLLQRCCGEADGLVPVDLLKLPLALLADATHRDRQAIRCIDRIEVAVDLATQSATRVRMILASAHAHGATILDIDLPRTGIGAVEWAGAVNDALHAASVREGGASGQVFSRCGDDARRRRRSGTGPAALAPASSRGATARR